MLPKQKNYLWPSKELSSIIEDYYTDCHTYIYLSFEIIFLLYMVIIPAHLRFLYDKLKRIFAGRMWLEEKSDLKTTITGKILACLNWC